ncbi:MAG: DUF5692 family protein [Spirochaetales bacterium]|nr:DUF5692 family protein [Spirochaetales bacterium]
MLSFSSYFISMTLYVLILILLTEVARRSVLFGFAMNIGFIVLLFFSKNVEGWFRWAKDLSVLIPMLVVHAGRFSSLKNRQDSLGKFLTGPKVLGFLWVILALNIFEASLKDLMLGNTFNGLCGFVMIACIPMSLKRSWRFDRKDKHILVADLSLAWCLLYTTWNAAFVYAESPAYVASSLCILLVPEIYNAISIRRGGGNMWLHARIYTLMIHVSIRSFADVFTPYMDASAWFNPVVRDVWGLVNFILMAAYAVYWFLPRNKEERTGLVTA